MSNIRTFQVGGSVRDKFLGVDSHDIDYAIEAPSFDVMHEHVKKITDKIFMVYPDKFTIRALHNGIGVDFVLCRKDGVYSDSRRPDTVEPGTILEDLSRRDFSINAMAIDLDTQELMDPFNGKADIATKTLRCVGDTQKRFNEDSLRIIRALRFAITKDFKPSNEIIDVFKSGEWAEKLLNISSERIREELTKCFKHNTCDTLVALTNLHPRYRKIMFSEYGIWLNPTTKS